MNNKLTLLSSVAALSLGELSLAEQTPTQQADNRFALEEVVVTAQKRAENLQDVPLAVSAFSGETLERNGIGDITGLDKRISGVVIGKEAVSRPYIYIRGIGTRSFDIGSEGSVGVFVDGVYVPRFSSAVQDLLAIERLEVLKGPQGTLYGRNTIGGAINVVTVEPSEELSGELRARFGNYGHWGVNGSASGPLSERVGFNLSASYSEGDGPQRETNTGREGLQETTALRGRLRIDATPDLRIDVIADYFKTDVDGFIAEFVPNPDRPVGAPPALISGPQVNGIIDGILAAGVADLESQALDVPGGIQREGHSLTLKTEWEGQPFTFTAITGFQHDELGETRDFDATALDLVDQIVDQESDSFSQELRLASTPGGALTFDDRVEWLVGAFYSHDEAERVDGYTIGADTLISFFATGGVAPFIRSADRTAVDLTSDSVALFAQGTVSLTDRLSLTLGLRYSEDKKDFVYQATTPTPGLPPVAADFTIEDDLTFTSTDPRITLDYALDENILLYATYSEGFKSGGVQYANADPTLASQTFKPERLNSYELGIKSRLLDDRVQINASTFFYEYEDQQILNVISVNGVPMGFTENAGSSELKGLDVEVQAALTLALTANLNYSYLDSEFTAFDSISGADLTGNELPRAPAHAIKTGLNYVHDLDKIGELILDAHYAWTDTYFFDESNRDYASQESVGIWDLSATLEFLDENFSVRIFCSNCTNETTFTNFTVFSDGSGGNATVGYGRRYGIGLKKVF